MQTTMIINKITSGEYDELFLDIYGDLSKIKCQRQRYVDAIKCFEKHFGQQEISIFSAPGRSEIGGNHTDHQNGKILAAAINLDTIGVVQKVSDNMVQVVSDGYDEINIFLDELEFHEEEKETTKALIKGVLAGMKEKRYKIGGFRVYITSDVLIGAGLSSSAAYETLIGTIVSGLYNEMSVRATEIAKIGQYAENTYFGKPCGLMDQMACSVGNLVYVDFSNEKEPYVEKLSFDLYRNGYSLCITDTKGSHADLTNEYAAIPSEMKQVANYFGKEILLGITSEDIWRAITSLRETVGDRGVLRALHFVLENERVQNQVEALKMGNVDMFLQNVKESGNSSYKYLQNVYSNQNVAHQNLSVALAFSDLFLGGRGVSRVHGGGFAGTIQAFVLNEEVEAYKKYMNAIFGEGACTDLKIRKYGGMKVI